MDTLDIEKQAGQVTTVEEVPMSPPLGSPTSPNPNRLSSLETYQILVGNIDEPRSPTKPGFSAPDDLYHEIVAEARKARFYYYSSGALFFFAVAMQIILCLSIAIGAQLGLTKDQISILAGVNTGVASTIGVLKGLGLPDKKGIERTKLQRMAQRIRTTTKKLKAGIEVDATADADDIKGLFEAAEDEAVFAYSAIGKTTSSTSAPPTSS